MLKEGINKRRVNLEHKFHRLRETDLVKDFVQYLSILKSISYVKLIQEQRTEKEIITITGELRILQQLLEVLELRDGTQENMLSNELNS